MKNAILLAALAIFIMMFTSCRKDYTCSCTYTDPATGAMQPPVIYHMGKRSEKEAKKNCRIKGLTFSSQYVNKNTAEAWICHI